MTKVFVLRHNPTNTFRKHSKGGFTYGVNNVPVGWHHQFTDDLAKARTYTNRGGAGNAIPFWKKDDPRRAEFEFVPVKIVIDE